MGHRGMRGDETVAQYEERQVVAYQKEIDAVRAGAACLTYDHFIEMMNLNDEEFGPNWRRTREFLS